MKFLFTCGGTAGHINPALGLAGRLRDLLPESEFLFIGAKGQMEAELVPREGFPIETVEIDNLSRSLSLEGLRHNLHTARLLLKSRGEAREILKRFRPDIAVGTGGYVCYPALRQAHALGIPTLVHEANAVPGLTTKMLSRSVDLVLLGFEQAKENYPRRARTEFTGTPVRRDFAKLDRAAARRALGLDLDRPLVVSVWGSLGSDHINGLMPDFVRVAQKRRSFDLIHSAGQRGFPALRAAVGDPEALRRQGIDLRAYIYDMPQVMAAADLVLCRSGASTLAELAVLGKPALLVPSPNVTAHQQERNAALMERLGAAKVLLEGSFDAAGLYDAAEALVRDAAALEKMGKATRQSGNADATERICTRILSYVT
ncbi:MAG: UDP-N-acetylglucosamine--N-acetylmuramyl-(pentapeptide) pyrophosphoryl-undecaprenol N-acetylglucosamine transferase [Oscillospiraceae bacterium]|nr:UDP-N-acetylglucosamine--N-acetylmuramyl-(pentapeptide) pyrophosphoryl-undecaprenol N-acetylglucosamine transferase [Oscillospiraceae bacterium]